MSKTVYTLLARILRAFYVKIHVRGFQNALQKTYSICVANHLGSFGPLALMTSLTHKLYPWVVHQVTDLKDCAEYIRSDFVEKELKLRSVVADGLSRIIGRICVHLMSYLKAIPVYGRSREIIKTFEISLSYLQSGKTLLIFPENDESKKQDDICMLNTGFIRLARWLFENNHKVVTFYPVAINKHVRGVRVGKPVRFDPSVPYCQEKMRIKHKLESSITTMYRALESESARHQNKVHNHRHLRGTSRAA
jgi:1-acyl-sn-glycerol-3-phosphate acyltransferase